MLNSSNLIVCLLFKVNVNPSYRPMELRYALNKVGIKAIVVAESFKNSNYYSILDEAVPELKNFKESVFIDSQIVPSLQSVIMMSNQHHKYYFYTYILFLIHLYNFTIFLWFTRGTWRFEDIFQMGGPKEINYIHSIQRKIQFDEPANIQFTSVYGNSIFLISTSAITFNL